MPRRATPVTVKGIKALREPGRYCDGRGLWLRVSGPTAKHWVFQCKAVTGKVRQMGLGSFPEVSPAEARDRASAQRKLVRNDVDPIARRDAERQRAKVAAAKDLTFKQAADRYIAAHEASWSNPAHRQQWFSTFNDTRRGSHAATFPPASS